MSETTAVSASAPRTARERARAELTREIADTARVHLEAQGAAGLSLRAVARDLGMVSSAIYRYFPSRDDLLTRLIIDAYDGLGDAVDSREGAIPREDLLGRWLAVAHGCRDWALQHPQEWALIYGSPVPGYAAPEATIGPGTRVSVTLITILADGFAQGITPEDSPVPAKVRRAMAPLREFVPPVVADSHLIAGFMARTQLFGHISLELDGQYTNTIDDLDSLFDHIMVRTAVTLGLA
jgi:AcrR family transcriptional regulator